MRIMSGWSSARAGMDTPRYTVPNCRPVGWRRHEYTRRGADVNNICFNGCRKTPIVLTSRDLAPTCRPTMGDDNGMKIERRPQQA